MAKSFTDYVQTVIVKKGLTGLFQCPAQSGVCLFYEANCSPFCLHEEMLECGVCIHSQICNEGNHDAGNSCDEVE